MARIVKKRKSLETIYAMLDNIKKLNGTRYNVDITMEDNGMGKSDNPAYYGSVLESGYWNKKGRNYKFLHPALIKNKAPLISKEDMNIYLEILKTDGKRRGKKEMLEACKLYGQYGVERVVNYIFNEAPQYPDRDRKNPTLLDTLNLVDSIKYVIKDKKGKVLGSGK